MLNRDKFIELMSSGNSAYDELREQYRPLVLKLVSKYFKQTEDEFEEAITVADEGIYFAINDFNVNKVGSDVTYLSIYILSEIFEHISKYQLIRIPEKTRSMVKKITDVQNDLYIIYGRDPEPDEISAEMGISTDEVKKYLNYKVAGISDTIDEFDEDGEPKNNDYVIKQYKDYIEKDSESLKDYVKLLNKKEQFILGYKDGKPIETKDYVKRKRLKVSEGQLDRLKVKLVQKLQILQAAEERKLPKGINKSIGSSKKKENELIPNPETKKEFLLRVTKIAFRLFPYIFLHIEDIIGDKIKLNMVLWYNIKKDKSGNWIAKWKEKDLNSNIPDIINFLLRFNPSDLNSDGTVTPIEMDPSGFPTKIPWINIVKKYGPEVYRHQMKEFFKALRASDGTIRRYCNPNKEGVEFKKDDMESFYKKVDGFMEKNGTITIPFEIVKKISGADFNDLKEYVDDRKIKHPYSVNFTKQELCREL